MTTYRPATRTLTATDGHRQTLVHVAMAGYFVSFGFPELNMTTRPELCPTREDVQALCASEGWPSPFVETRS